MLGTTRLAPNGHRLVRHTLPNITRACPRLQTQHDGEERKRCGRKTMSGVLFLRTYGFTRVQRAGMYDSHRTHHRHSNMRCDALHLRANHTPSHQHPLIPSVPTAATFLFLPPPRADHVEHESLCSSRSPWTRKSRCASRSMLERPNSCSFPCHARKEDC